MKVNLLSAAWSAVEAHACRSYPNEACGVLLGRSGDPGEILEAHPCANVNAERSRDRYLIDPHEQMRIEKDGRLRSFDVVGYYHSHPGHPAQASVTDLEHSWEDFLYLIVSVRDGKAVERRVWRRAHGTRGFSEVGLL